jgi:predicted HTH transcriptional regulator
MGMEFYLKLILAAYKVTELFPAEGEELKSQIRESANQALADLLLNRQAKIDDLLTLFSEAEAKNWVDSRNFAVLRREYGKIKIDQPFPIHRVTKPRHKKILDIINERNRIQVSGLAQVFPGLSRRTIIRDLEELFHNGIVIRTGSGRGVSYSNKIVT